MIVNRKNDYAFKRIFGHEDSKDVLARFLSVVLNVSIKTEELTLIQTELSPQCVADKSSILDIQPKFPIDYSIHISISISFAFITEF